MAETTRTFVAIPLPPAVIAELERLQMRLAPAFTGVRWVRGNSMHLTLAFLGDVKNSALHKIGEAVAAVASGIAPFALRVEALGVFPGLQRPRTLWTGIAGEQLPSLLTAQKSVADAVARLGYPADERFHPHVTLGRIKPGRAALPDLAGTLARHRTWSAGALPVAEITTYSSTTTPDGPIYAPLATARLGLGKTPPTA